MTDEDVDKVLQKTSTPASQVDAVLLNRIADSINSSLRPVRPVPPTWMLTGGLVVVCAAVAVTVASRIGFYGVEKLAIWERVAHLFDSRNPGVDDGEGVRAHN